jgi:uncharacterized Zn-binding protein involved in type VI secretion
LNVQTNDLNQARATDRAQCAGPPDFIVTGSATVTINDLMAARQTDKTMHGGMIVIGSPNVEIGGPAAGATLGNVIAGTAVCVAASAGRASFSAQQSYENCGVESARQIINAFHGGSVEEKPLLASALFHRDAARGKTLKKSGATTANGIKKILARNHVQSTLQDQTMPNIAQAVAEGRGVITGHDVSVLWGPA